ncbi:MAG: DNA-directed RNA polymerase subunit RpoH/Rpb5 C-terminal domain-containing protein [Nanoarchaeota archaeon]
MHILQPKHSKLKRDDAEKLLIKFNISLSQLPKINSTDSLLPKDTSIGDIIKIERKDEDGKINEYYRVAV